MKVQVISATQNVLQYLRDAIIMGELAPGQKLNETLLASELGISRPPIREAFRILEGERLLINVPRKSSFVAEISRRDFEEVYEARKMIESNAIDLFQKKKVEDFSSLRLALDEASLSAMKPVTEPKQALERARAYSSFHVRLIELAGNTTISDFYSSITNRIFRYQFMYFAKGKRQALLEEEHHKIFTLLTQGEYRQAKKQLLLHMDYSSDEMVKKKDYP